VVEFNAEGLVGDGYSGGDQADCGAMGATHGLIGN